jgi:hypothetical protein
MFHFKAFAQTSFFFFFWFKQTFLMLKIILNLLNAILNKFSIKGHNFLFVCEPFIINTLEFSKFNFKTLF